MRISAGILAILGFAILFLTAGPLLVRAQDSTLGQVTHLPLPRYMSLKGDKANVRRGPSTSNRIDWVFTHRGTPLLVLAEYSDWLRVRDVDGEGGWIYAPLLSTVRTILVQENMLYLRESAEDSALPLAQLEAGVIAVLGACSPGWCAISIEGVEGWIPKSGIWGVGESELLE